ncbi:hypothetical protein ACFOG5_19055 [Pedobacter fastidiosus]|uniref:DUF3592 domain-containing protein n=1 Tax=Pedobacter fastidiosus TaxID=2765361 RepID=A0ABR7KSW1_9SPHI|nr:hypothetical protein [Pedobacter fastidiosus]MBC6111177.1 hypothetical protein [Pedobacter fastidiosus]
MEIKRIKAQTILFFKEIYNVWFPWLDIAILILIYFFLWGEHISPDRHFQLIKHGSVAIGKISGEAGLYQYSDSPRMRDFEYTFTLPNGKVIKSSAHTFTLDKVAWKKSNYPVNAEISYLPNKPQINWIKSDLSDNLGDFFYRNLIFGTLFIAMVYMIGMIVCRLSVLEHRKEKLAKLFAKHEHILIQLPKERLN